jgi:hypothetical protein
MKGLPHGIGMQTLNCANLTPVQDGPDQEDHICVKKSEDQKEKRKRKNRFSIPVKFIFFLTGSAFQIPRL